MAFLSENKQRKFISCDKDSSGAREMMTSAICIFSSYVFNADSDIEEKESARSIARTVFYACWRQHSGKVVQVS